MEKQAGGRPPGNPSSSERGIALLFVLFVSVLLTLLGLSLTLTSIWEQQSSRAYENYIQATALADAAIDLGRARLRGQDFNVVLATPGLVAAYPNEVQPSPGTVAYRNPMTLRAARFLDFDAGNFSLVQTTGLLTPATGSVLGNGRYFLKVTDNQDEAKMLPGSPDNPLVDVDFEVIVRGFGVVQNAPGEIVNQETGSSRSNSIATLEISVRRNMTFDVKSPLTVYGPNAVPYQSNTFFNGNAFDLDGYDHSALTVQQILDGHNDTGLGAMPGLATLYDNATGEDGIPTAVSIYQNLQENQHDNIFGAESMFDPGSPDPSIRDTTSDVRDSPYPDSSKIFDPKYVATFLQRLKSYADIKYTGNTQVTGGDPPLGTSDQPAITYVDGDLDLSGNNSGSGLLVVRGTLKFRGSFTYDGVILVMGKGELDVAGANNGIIGGLFLANLVQNPDGSYTYGIPQFRISGNSNFYFRSASVRMAINLLPLKMKGWREISPEIEPAS